MKKCKFCMSDIDEKAKICPHCRKRQKSRLSTIFLVIFGLLVMSGIYSTILEKIEESKINDIKDKANRLILSSLEQFSKDTLEDESLTTKCYYVDDIGYDGSVKVWLDNGNSYAKIYLSNGKYYLFGEKGDDFKVIESTKKASTNCETEVSNEYNSDNAEITSEEVQTNLKTMYEEKCEEYDYKTIFRYAEDYEGKYAKFTGRVVQIQKNDYSDFYILRVNVTKDNYGYYSDTIYVTYKEPQGATRILEDDIVTIYGTLQGTATYTTILGSEVTLPQIFSLYIEVIS